jgi:hypothetical protein
MSAESLGKARLTVITGGHPSAEEVTHQLAAVQ